MALRRPGPNPTVDLVVLRSGDFSDEILLIQRVDTAKAEPGKWALPGGFHDTTAAVGAAWEPGFESAEAACLRELREETSLDLSDLAECLTPVGVYEGGGRDPRDSDTAWCRSHLFVVRLPVGFDVCSVQAADDASAVDWFAIGALPKPLAFDHDRLVGDALALAR